MSDVLPRPEIVRPEIVREISGADEFGIVEKELTVFERLYNLGWVRKTCSADPARDPLGELRAISGQPVAGAHPERHAPRLVGRHVQRRAAGSGRWRR